MDTDIRLVREEGRGHSDSTHKSDYQLDWPDISELVSKLNFDLVFWVFVCDFSNRLLLC